MGQATVTDSVFECCLRREQPLNLDIIPVYITQVLWVYKVKKWRIKDYNCLIDQK